MLKILFVCTGNTCRSPLAAALLKEKAPRTEVQSAGLFAGHGQPASRNTVEVLKKRGISLQHQTQPLDGKLMEWADLILAMTTQHKQSIAIQYPAHQEKLFTLKEYVSKEKEDDNWEELKQAYSDFEEKRAQFLRENGKSLSPLELENALYQHFQKEINHIHQLEASQPDHDVSDPFGGSLANYQETLDELEKYVDLLVKKLNLT